MYLVRRLLKYRALAGRVTPEMLAIVDTLADPDDGVGDDWACGDVRGPMAELARVLRELTGGRLKR